jgi:trehalose 6-phosphate phosphatase
LTDARQRVGVGGYVCVAPTGRPARGGAWTRGGGARLGTQERARAERAISELRDRAGEAALCLDFDGTLAPIVDDPDDAAPLPGTLELLGRLATRFRAVALVSGRPARFLADRAPAPGVAHVGLYGMELVTDGQVRVDPEVDAWRGTVAEARADLAAHPAVTGSGAYLEDKGLSVGVHLRRVADPGRWAGPLEAAAGEVAERHGLRVAPGKLVWELRPPIDRDKGDAVQRVVDEVGARVLAMAGDDLGDLAAFATVERLVRAGGAGLRIAVASDESPPELLAAADLVVQGPEGLRELLERLA